MKKLRNLVNSKPAAIALPVLLFIGLLGFNACTKDKVSKIELMNLEEMANKELAEKVDISYTDSGMLKATIHAAVIIVNKNTENPTTEMKEGLNADFYGPDKTVESSLRADYGIHYETEKKMEVRSNVMVNNEKGERLNTEKLIWDIQQQTIHTDKPVTITTKDKIIKGKGMTADQNFRKWTIANVTGIIAIPDEQRVVSGDSGLDSNGHIGQ